jgi:hypothetical protein
MLRSLWSKVWLTSTEFIATSSTYHDVFSLESISMFGRGLT